LLVQCARRLKQEEAMLRYAEQLRKRHPQSTWTMDAHRWAGNHYLLDDNAAQFVPLFSACAEAQPRHVDSAYCHWKVAWHAYRERKVDAHVLMAAHLERYPFSDKYAAALLFLGRLAERDRRLAAARAYYEELTVVEPLSYYAQLAQESLQGRLLKGISADMELSRILQSYRARPLREDFHDLKPNADTQRRLSRATMLARVHFMDWVEMEVRQEGIDAQQRQLLAVGLANIYAKRDDHFRALRTMKSMAPGYFRLQPTQAPQRFWELLFPMPYQESLASYSKQRNLDPYLVAGLIRQESEFKPDAVSRAKAYGLMQVLPGTGRSLARTLGLGTFRISMLTLPETNVNMGTYYLSKLAASFDGRLEYVLASYNAGKSRADRWKTWGEFEEPIEFIESIPFTETREYVLSVYRNAMVYRAVYPELGKAPTRLQPVATPVAAERPAGSAKPAARKTAGRKPAAGKSAPRKTTRTKAATKP
jgi:soluble lytic murein transglycosylase